MDNNLVTKLLFARVKSGSISMETLEARLAENFDADTVSYVMNSIRAMQLAEEAMYQTSTVSAKTDPSAN